MLKYQKHRVGDVLKFDKTKLSNEIIESNEFEPKWVIGNSKSVKVTADSDNIFNYTVSESDIGKIIQFRLNKELESSPIIIDDIYVNRTESSSDDVTRCITFRINSQNNTDYLEFKSIEFDIDFNPDVLMEISTFKIYIMLTAIHKIILLMKYLVIWKWYCNNKRGYDRTCY